MGQIVSTIFVNERASEKELFPSAIEINEENRLSPTNRSKKSVRIEYYSN